MSADKEFSVYWWDASGGQHEELRYDLPQVAMRAVQRLTRGPASVLGIVSRVIITDGGDCCVFEWTKKDGITWPKKES